MIKEIKTPTDNRTWQRKWLVKRSKEVKRSSEYGFFAHLRIKDINLFINHLQSAN